MRTLCRPCNLIACASSLVTALRQQTMTMAQVQFLKDKAQELCVGSASGRQAMWCDRIEIFDIVEANGVYGNTDSVPPRREKCFYYKKDNGWHMNIQKGIACFSA
jgi:hypothetical protein